MLKKTKKIFYVIILTNKNIFLTLIDWFVEFFKQQLFP
jgi:hypothetical protein